MKIVLAGGSGFIGKEFIRRCNARGSSVSLLTRNPSGAAVHAFKSVRVVPWDALSIDDWISEIDGADAVVNLGGEPIAAKRWNYDQKYRILISRVDATRGLVYAIQHATKKPSVLINASAAGYYGNVKSGDVTESHKGGNDFLSRVCEKWEEAALQAEKFGVRVVLSRFGVVLGEGGGLLQKMLPPFQFYVGGWPGSGRQWLPWIHRDDVVSALLHAMDNTSLAGPVNLSAPEAVTMKQFCRALGKAMGRPCWVPVPALALRLVLGEMSEMLTSGQRLVPSKLTQNGYTFHFPKLQDALMDIFS